MGKFWLGVGLLTVMLVFGVWSMQRMAYHHEQLGDVLAEASTAALEGDRETAKKLVSRAKQQWQRRWQPLAAVSDHAPMNELDGSFARMEASIRGNDIPEFAAECARAAQLLKALGDAQRFSWWNLL